MKNSIIVIAFLPLVFIVFSCSSPLNCKKPFQLFKEPVINGEPGTKMRLNGIYVSSISRGCMVFYSDGSFKTISSNSPEGDIFWKNPDSIFEGINKLWYYDSKEGWGSYQIKGDSLIIQSFGRANDHFCKRSVYKEIGKVMNDSTIVINSDYSYWFKTNLLDGPNVFRFYPTTQKPDSTKAWFNNKRWYKNNLHESRR